MAETFHRNGIRAASLASLVRFSQRRDTGLLGRYFSGCVLLFSIQLLLGKFFLPWFGGTPAMWTTCMFFFQMLLLADTPTPTLWPTGSVRGCRRHCTVCCCWQL